jgi:hypothetical protein
MVTLVAVKVVSVKANNHRRAFEVRTRKETLVFPYARVTPQPGAHDRIVEVCVDKELGQEGFTYVLESGKEGSVHVDSVLDYNEDPHYLADLLLYQLTVEAQRRIADSPLSKREIARRLGTSVPQLYRLLDQANYRKSLQKVVSLLSVLDCDVKLTVRKRPHGRSAKRLAG